MVSIQLADGTHTTVAQVVNIVDVATPSRSQPAPLHTGDDIVTGPACACCLPCRAPGACLHLLHANRGKGHKRFRIKRTACRKQVATRLRLWALARTHKPAVRYPLKRGCRGSMFLSAAMVLRMLGPTLMVVDVEAVGFSKMPASIQLFGLYPPWRR